MPIPAEALPASSARFSPQFYRVRGWGGVVIGLLLSVAGIVGVCFFLDSYLHQGQPGRPLRGAFSAEFAGRLVMLSASFLLMGLGFAIHGVFEARTSRQAPGWLRVVLICLICLTLGQFIRL